MDYEKAYKEALERARRLEENSNGMILKKWLWNVFPELTESEDERIRKEFCKDIWTFIPNEKAHKYIAWLEKQGEQKEQTLLNDNNKKYHRVPSTTLKRLYMNEAKYELLKEDITDGYIDTFVKEGSHNYLKIKIPMILCPTNCKKGDKVKLIIVKDK